MHTHTRARTHTGHAPQMRVRVTVGVPPAIRRNSTGRCRVNRALFGDIGATQIPPLRRSKAQHGGEHRAACVPVAAARHVNVQHDRTRRQARPTVADRTRVDHGRDFVCVCKHGAVLLGVDSVDGKEVAEHGWCCRKHCAVLWEENAVAVHGGGDPRDEALHVGDGHALLRGARVALLTHTPLWFVDDLDDDVHHAGVGLIRPGFESGGMSSRSLANPVRSLHTGALTADCETREGSQGRLQVHSGEDLLPSRHAAWRRTWARSRMSSVGMRELLM